MDGQMSLFMDHVVREKNNAKMLHSISKKMVFICLTDIVQYIVHLIGPGAGAQVRRGLVAARPEVAVPGGVDALGVVGPRLVHVLHIGACQTR